MSRTPLTHLLSTSRDASSVVAVGPTQNWNWEHFHGRVAAVAERLRPREESGWAICCRDAYSFLSALFGVLHSGKQAIIPPNFQPGTLDLLRGEVNGWLVDDAQHAGTLFPFIDVSALPAGDVRTLRPLANDTLVDLFTSGTTGAPKRVRKRFLQLATEVEVLESTWGSRLATATVVGTVPHYYIYGLLFRLLWPLYAARPFETAICGDPNELVQGLRRHARAVIVSSPAYLDRLPQLIDPAQLAPQAAMIFSSGGPLAYKSARAYLAGLGIAPVEVYGSSETGGIAWRVQTDESDAQAWTPLPRVAVRRGDDGALQVHSPFADAQDWFPTSDGVEMHADGRFRLMGRLDRVVKVEEKRLSLTQMEDRLREHPWVTDAGVVLLDGARRTLAAVLTLSAVGAEHLHHVGKAQLVKDLKTFLSGYYEPTLLPRRWRFPDDMPRNERGKVSSHALSGMFADADVQEH